MTLELQVDPRQDAFGSQNKGVPMRLSTTADQKQPPIDEKKEEEEELVSNFDEIFEYVMETCMIQARADRKDVQYIFTHVLPKSKTQKCFVACWLELFQVVSVKSQ